MVLPELYKYNPHQIPAKDLEASFVGRESLLLGVLDDLRDRAGAPVNQHMLITGPRGVGKTNFLLMIRNCVCKDPVLSEAYLPVQTAEEEYSISSLFEFFSKILGLLAEQAPDPVLNSAVGSIAASRDEDQGAELAIDAIRAFSERAHRKTLLLVDNFDLILGDQMTDDAELGRLRDVLMNEAFLVLVAAAPTYFREVSGYNRPFYQFFKHVELRELSFGQTQELLQRRAELDGNRALLDRLEELTPRFRLVHHLTGGNPRLGLMLYQLSAYGELPEIRAAIQMLLDDVTPYYKLRLEKLSPQQRKVVDTFARLGRPATPTEMAQGARLSVNHVASTLNRLRELGFVTPAQQKRRRTTHYMLSERVFRIWHQMRFSTAGRKRLEFLIEFLRVWFSPEEWQQEAARLMHQYEQLTETRRYDDSERIIEHLGYLAEAAPEAGRGYALVEDVVRKCINSGDFIHAQQILTERIQRFTLGDEQDLLAKTWYLAAFLSNSQGRREEEMHALERAVQLRPDYCEALCNWGKALADLARTKTGTEQDELFHQACVRYQAAVAVKPDMHQALYNWGAALASLAVAKSGPERSRLLLDAAARVSKALEIGEESGTGEVVSLYAALYVGLALWQCADAVDARNWGDAHRLFDTALERAPGANPRYMTTEYIRLFWRIARRTTAGLCREFLRKIRHRGMDDLAEILAPYTCAVDYWLAGKDPELVLDQLNPELREIVEKIIQRGEEGTANQREAAMPPTRTR